MTANAPQKLPDLSIIKIKESSFFVNEFLFKPNKEVAANLIQKMGFNLEKELVDFTMQVEHKYMDTDEVFAFIEVHNFFKIVELKKFVDISVEPNNVKIPPHTLLIMLTLSISHTRALLSKNMLGTPFGNVLMPIIDPMDAALFLFPNVFKKIKANNQIANSK